MPNGVQLPELLPMSMWFGGLTTVEKKIIFNDGNAIPYLPKFKGQSGVYMDTFGCVSHSHNKGVRTLLKAIYNVDYDFADRDLIVLSGTKPNFGNSGNKVLETSQSKGLVSFEFEDFDLKSRDPKYVVERYYAYARNKDAEKDAQVFNDDWELYGEWVHRSKWEEASKYGILQLYVKAWHIDDNGEYYNPSTSYNHAVILANYKERKISDTYEPELKTLRSYDDAYQLALKITIIKKNMNKPIIKDNSLVFTTGHGGLFGIYLDGKIIYDDLSKILAMAIMRSEVKNEGTEDEYTALVKKTITGEQWDMFEKVNLKGEKLS